MSSKRAQIRTKIRKIRNNLSKNKQLIAAQSLKVNFTQHLKSKKTPKKKTYRHLL